MNISERLFAHLSRRNYVPAPADAISKEWRLNPKQRRAFNTEVG